MRLLRRSLLSLVFLFAFAFVAPAGAQTTGGIVGRVTDEGGGVLPGVTVEATGPALQGARTAVTDGSGGYHLSLLPPGDYAVSFNLNGFAPETRKGIGVALGKDAQLNSTLRAAL